MTPAFIIRLKETIAGIVVSATYTIKSFCKVVQTYKWVVLIPCMPIFRSYHPSVWTKTTIQFVKDGSRLQSLRSFKSH